MKRIILCGMMVSLVLAAACGIRPRHDGRTEIKVVMDGNFAPNPLKEGATSRAQTEAVKYYLLLKVSAPDMDELTFYNPDYILGSDWLIILPNGNNRTFELLMYAVGGAATGAFNIGFYSPDSPAETRTFDLTGTPLTVTMPMAPQVTAMVGTTGGATPDGLLKMQQGATVVPIPGCNFDLQAFLTDAEFPDLQMGPAIITMSNTVDGYYRISNVPTGRSLELKVVRPDMGWEGYSGSFSLPAVAQVNPVNITLSGWNNFRAVPSDFLVPNGDTTFSASISFSGGWGASGSRHVSDGLNTLGGPFVNLSPLSGSTLLGNILTYDVVTMYGSTYMYDVQDSVTVSDSCPLSGPKPVATITPWWYKVPWLDSYWSMSDICCGGPYYNFCVPLAGDTIYLYGDHFDNPANPGPPPVSVQAPEVFFDVVGPAGYRPVGYASETEVDFRAPPASAGLHTVTVRNVRSNSLFSDFSGFFDTIMVWYSDTCSGGT